MLERQNKKQAGRKRTRKGVPVAAESIDDYYDRLRHLDADMIQRIKDYQEQIVKSEGFDVPEPPLPSFGYFGPEDDLDAPDVVDKAKFAVDEQNKIEEQNHQGRKMELIRIIKAMLQVGGGLTYYLTIEVKDHVGNKMVCQAKVSKFVENQLLLFRQIPAC